MSSIFLHYADARRLVAAIRKLRYPVVLEDATIVFCEAFQIYNGLFYRKLKEPPVDQPGLNLTNEIYLKIAGLLNEHAGSSLRNRECIELVAGAFGWRGDAFMHHLKATTKHLPCNASVIETPGKTAIQQIMDLGFTGIENWLESLQAPNGLCIISGPAGSGKSTLQRLSVLHVRETGANALVCRREDASDDFSVMRMRAVAEGWLSSADTATKLVLMLPEIRNASDLEFALKCSKSCLVVTCCHAASTWETIESLLAYGVPQEQLQDSIRGIANMKLMKKSIAKVLEDPNKGRRIPVCENAVFRSPDEFFRVSAFATPRRVAKKLNLDLDDVFNERLPWQTADKIVADLKAAGEIES
jgi:hypothetical protein